MTETTTLPAEVLGGLVRASLSGTELRVALWVACESYGREVERAVAPSRQVATALRIDRSNARRALGRLVELGILDHRLGRGRVPSSYAFAPLAGWPEVALLAPEEPPEGSTRNAIRWTVNVIYNTHGVKRRVSAPGSETVRRLERLAREHSTTAARISRALLLGYVARNGYADLRDEGFNPYSKWTLTSVVRPANSDSNIEAYLEARRLGWRPDQIWKKGAADTRPPRQRVDRQSRVPARIDEASITDVSSAIRASLEGASRAREG